MKNTSEIKIGITGVITIIVMIWGVNYLKGRNILKSKYNLIVQYEQLDGLEASANVMTKGFKIGTVEKITFESEKEIPFNVLLEIEKDYKIPKGSRAEIYSSNLIGSKAVNIIPSDQAHNYEDGEVMSGSLSADMLSSLQDDLSPLIIAIRGAVMTLDSTAKYINEILNNPDIDEIVGNLEDVSGSVSYQLSDNGEFTATLKNLGAISDNIQSQNAAIARSIQNLDQVSGQIAGSDLDSLITHLNKVAGNLTDITDEMKNKNGSMGKLIYDDQLYIQINQLTASLDSLVSDINENPKKYVSFSLFGK